MEMKQSICDKDCFHCRFSDCVNHYGPYTEAKDIKKALNGQKKSRPRDWHHEERQTKTTEYILNQNRRFVKWTIKS